MKNSLQEIKQALANNQKLKDEYFAIYGFDYKKYEKEMVHPFGIYFFTLYSNDKFAKQQLDFLKALMNGNLSYLNKNKNTKWFYKEHPALHAKKAFAPIMRKHFPDITRIEKSFPSELFLLADINPDYVAGYSSSSFMNVNKNNIIAYIKRPNDPYLVVIKRNHRIRPGRAFDIEDVSNFKGFFKRIISRIFVIFQK